MRWGRGWKDRPAVPWAPGGSPELFKAWVLSSAGLWAKHFTSLSLSFLTPTMGVLGILEVPAPRSYLEV